MEAYKRDAIEESATGRVLVHDPKSGVTRVLASGLSFANGVALSTDERWLFVNETSRYRIWRLPIGARNLELSGGPNGGAAIVFDNLPGFPDNLCAASPARMGGRASGSASPSRAVRSSKAGRQAKLAQSRAAPAECIAANPKKPRPRLRLLRRWPSRRRSAGPDGFLSRNDRRRRIWRADLHCQPDSQTYRWMQRPDDSPCQRKGPHNSSAARPAAVS